MQNVKIKGYLAAISAAILTGALGVFVRNITVNTYIITFVRLALSFIFLVIFLLIKKDIRIIKLKQLPFSLVVTGVLMALAILSYMTSLQSISLASAAFLLHLGPLIAVVIASLVLKEKFTLLNIILLSTVFLGFMCLMEFSFSFNSQETKGYIWGLVCALCYALYIVFNRKIPANIPALSRSFYQFLFGALTMAPFVDRSIFTLSSSDIYWLLATGFFQGFLALTLFILAVKYLKAVEYGILTYVEPVFAALVGYFFYSEMLSVLQIAGCVIVILGGMIQVLSVKKSSVS